MRVGQKIIILDVLVAFWQEWVKPAFSQSWEYMYIKFVFHETLFYYPCLKNLEHWNRLNTSFSGFLHEEVVFPDEIYLILILQSTKLILLTAICWLDHILSITSKYFDSNFMCTYISTSRIWARNLVQKH